MRWMAPTLVRHEGTMGYADQCAGLAFGGESVCPDGRYYLRGGICWPTHLEEGGFRGAALMGALHLRSKALYIVAEESFTVIDHLVDAEGVVTHKGLAPWFARVWGTWGGHVYYWHQEEETHRRYLLQVIRSPMIVPQPGLVEVPWSDDEAARLTVYERDTCGRLFYRRDGLVHGDMEAFNADPDGEYPALHALTCLCVGLGLYPYRASN